MPVLHEASSSECYGKGTEPKPACPVPECNKEHAKDLHDLMKTPSLVDMLGIKEDEEGCMNMIMGEGDCQRERSGAHQITPAWKWNTRTRINLPYD
jgi:hypothetical protein